MRVLIGCEFSGVVRDAFRARGHDSWSADLLPTESQSANHFTGDVLRAVADAGPWNMMIAHPPCTYLCNSGVRWLAPRGKINAARYNLMVEACDFFAALYHAPIARVCIENPVMHGYAREYLLSRWNVPAFTQSIQPWQHGHGEIKRTCLWTRGLPSLQPSKIVEGRKPVVHHASPGPDRWKLRSRTLKGIADAMANQWVQS